VDKGRVFHDYAKSVRLNKHQCGPQGKWFAEIVEEPKKTITIIDELFEDFDM
jgi:hypothetical protein